MATAGRVAPLLGALCVTGALACGDDDGCPGGAYDLAELADPDGTSTVELGVLTTDSDNPDFLGGPIGETDEVVVCVPDDTVALAFFARSQPGEIYFTSLEVPGEGQQIDGSSIDAFADGLNQFFLEEIAETVTTPAEADGQVDPGVYRFRVGASRTEVSAEVAVRRGNPDDVSSLPVNLVLVDGVVSAAEQDQIAATVGRLQELMQLADIDIDIGYGRITGDFAPYIDDGPGRLALAEAELANLEGEPPPLSGALNVYFTEGAKSGAQCAAGISTGLPGVPGDPRSPGIVLDLGLLRSGDTLSAETTWQTAAHEIFHFVGLYHTSEIGGLFHDRIDDTPRCTEDADANGDSVVDSDECAGLGADNLMFWEATDISVPVITATQGEVARRNLFAPR